MFKRKYIMLLSILTLYLSFGTVACSNATKERAGSETQSTSVSGKGDQANETVSGVSDSLEKKTENYIRKQFHCNQPFSRSEYKESNPRLDYGDKPVQFERHGLFEFSNGPEGDVDSLHTWAVYYPDGTFAGYIMNAVGHIWERRDGQTGGEQRAVSVHEGLMLNPSAEGTQFTELEFDEDADFDCSKSIFENDANPTALDGEEASEALKQADEEQFERSVGEKPSGVQDAAEDFTPNPVRYDCYNEVSDESRHHAEFFRVYRTSNKTDLVGYAYRVHFDFDDDCQPTETAKFDISGNLISDTLDFDNSTSVDREDFVTKAAKCMLPDPMNNRNGLDFSFARVAYSDIPTEISEAVETDEPRTAVGEKTIRIFSPGNNVRIGWLTGYWTYDDVASAHSNESKRVVEWKAFVETSEGDFELVMDYGGHINFDDARYSDYNCPLD